ncbi:hypothetical protein [Amycolatopsis magusensis]|uniref:hypothetical protein n=1 Tax=Amycolatopsis magusensis TaxID=882444 RepID=UPI0037A3EAB3
MTDPRRTGIPEVDALINTREAEQRTLDELIVVHKAENTVTTARSADLLAQQAAARRRWAAAKGLLTKAQELGGAVEIAAARERRDRAYVELERISDAVTREMQLITSARLDDLGKTMLQMRRSWDAGSAVIDALARPARHEPPGGGR